VLYKCCVGVLCVKHAVCVSQSFKGTAGALRGSICFSFSVLTWCVDKKKYEVLSSSSTCVR